jgi:hypothetical protein
VAALIAALKAEYPAFRPYQIGTICYVRFGRRPGASTIANVCTRLLPAPPVPRRYPPYAEIPDPTPRRLAVIRLHIAGYLQVSR